MPRVSRGSVPLAAVLDIQAATHTQQAHDQLFPVRVDWRGDPLERGQVFNLSQGAVWHH